MMTLINQPKMPKVRILMGKRMIFRMGRKKALIKLKTKAAKNRVLRSFW